MIELEPNPADEVVEVALGEAELDALFVVGGEFEAVDYFEHEEEGRGRAVGLLVLLLGQFPVGHDIPHDLRLVDGGLLQLLVLEVDDLEEAQHLGADAMAIDAELVYDPLLDVCEGVVGLDPDEDAVADGQVDGDGDLALAHEGHHLVLDGHVADHGRVLDLPDHLLEEVAQVVLLLLAALPVREFLVEQEQHCHQEILIRDVDVQEDCQ